MEELSGPGRRSSQKPVCLLSSPQGLWRPCPGHLQHPQQGGIGATGGTRAACSSRHACEHGSLQVRGQAGCPAGAAAPPRPLPWRGDSVPWRCPLGLLGRRVPGAAGTQRHPGASTAPRLGLDKEVSMGGGVSPPPQGSVPPPRRGSSPADMHRLMSGRRQRKSFLG